MKSLLKFLCVSIILFGLSATNIDKKVVVLDIGHGGNDFGAKSETISEKDLNLAIAKKVKALALESDIEVVLSRDSDKFLSLADRVAFIKRVNPSAVLSLHINTSKNLEHHGAEIYINPDNGDIASKALAEKINQHLPIALKKGTVKTGNFYLLKNMSCPATIVELGYLTNTKDLSYLKSELGQAEIAKAILESIR